MAENIPLILFVSIDSSGLAPRPVADFHKHMGADPWYPQAEVDRLRELVRKSYHALDPDRPTGPLPDALLQKVRKTLEAEVRKHFPGEIRGG